VFLWDHGWKRPDFGLRHRDPAGGMEASNGTLYRSELFCAAERFFLTNRYRGRLDFQSAEVSAIRPAAFCIETGHDRQVVYPTIRDSALLAN
jgi:hypothetical protein